jgi:putative endopeptidase
MKTKTTRKNSSNKTKKNIVKMVKAVKVPEGCDVIGLQSFENKMGSYELTTKQKVEKTKKLFAKELVSNFSPKSIKPNNDFYSYINYNWLKNVTLENKQKYLVQIDDFRLAQDNVYHELEKIIKDYIRTHDDSLSKNLDKFYKSTTNFISKEYCTKVSKDVVKQIDELREDKNNLWKMLAMVNSSEMTSSQCPFSWSMAPDNKDPTVFRAYISPCTFPIVDLSVYYNDGQNENYKNKLRKNFKDYCKSLFKAVLPDEAKKVNINDIYDVHVDIFNTLGCSDVSTNDSNYNKVYASDSLKKYGFDWTQFSKELGFKKTPDFFISTSLNYLKCGTDLLMENWNSEKWRPFWIWIFLRRNIRLTKGLNELYFKYYGKEQRGQEQIVRDKSVSAVLLMSLPFNAFLANEYIRKFKNPRVVKYVETMCEDLKVVFTRIINRNTWLSPSTKKYALLKLKHLTFTYGNPEFIRADPMLDYTENIYDNLDKIYTWRHNNMVQFNGEKVVDIPYIDWNKYPLKLTGNQPYIVNASYTPSKNGIYINLGFMQKPFVDLDEKGIEYNLAYLGYTIGHEMSHGLDNWGSQYDYEGKLHNWWTPEDKKKFNAIQDDVKKQYEEWTARDGLKYDATIGLGEDLADISGLAICDEYLRDYQKYNKDFIPIRYLSYQTFYTYYSIHMKQRVGKKAISAQLLTNPHPPDKYRTNVPLSRSNYFRSIYNVKKGDGMWWHNTNTIW